MIDIDDYEIFSLIKKERDRQDYGIELIASENYASKAIMEAQGSVLTNKYAEGYPNKRYYNGCMYVDGVEQLAIDRAKQLFGCKYVNVQPHSGASANLAVCYAFLNAGDAILGMDLNSGGHLTHGFSKNYSGKWFKAFNYGVNDEGYIDYDEVRKIALQCKPKMIIAGISSYPRIIDWQKFRNIADEVGAILHVDMAHVAGLVAGGVYPSPILIADVTTTTTHKTLRGPRGGMIMCNKEEFAKKIDSAIFPGTQGGPLMHVIAGKAIMLKEALDDSFKLYAQNVVKNTKALAEALMKRNINLITNGTDSHLIIADLRGHNVSGADICTALENVEITANKNLIPNDPLPSTKTSGIRLGAAACTTRGFNEHDFEIVGNLIADVIDCMQKNVAISSEEIKLKVRKLTAKYPIY